MLGRAPSSSARLAAHRRGSRRQVGMEWIEKREPIVKGARRKRLPFPRPGSLVGSLRGWPGNRLREQEPQDPERGIGHHEGQDDDPEHPVGIRPLVNEHEEERCSKPGRQQCEDSKGPNRDHTRRLRQGSRSVQQATLLSPRHSRCQHSGRTRQWPATRATKAKTTRRQRPPPSGPRRRASGLMPWSEPREPEQPPRRTRSRRPRQHQASCPFLAAYSQRETTSGVK